MIEQLEKSDMSCEYGFTIPTLETCFEQIHQIFKEEGKNYEEQISKLEEEKTILHGLLENQKNLEKEIVDVKNENKMLKEELSLLTLTSNEKESQILKLEKRYEILRKNVAKKQSDWSRFLHTIKKKCSCKFKDSLNKNDTPDYTLTVKVKNVSNVFFKSPVKPKLNYSGIAALAPMTEDYNVDTPKGEFKASTPFVVGETEKSPCFFYEIDSNEDDSGEEWLNSPSLFSDNESKMKVRTTTPSEKNMKLQINKKPMNPADLYKSTPIKDDNSAEENKVNVEISTELFSDNSLLNIKDKFKIPNDVAIRPTKEDCYQKVCADALTKTSKVIVNKISDDAISNVDFSKQTNICKEQSKSSKLNYDQGFIEKVTFLDSVPKKSKCMPGIDPDNQPNSNPCSSKKSCDSVLKKDIEDNTDISNPKKPDGSYKYSVVIRKKEEREKLKGYACEECKRYYQSDNLSESRMKEVLKHCSRHKHLSSPPPSTPEDFWTIDFPPTQDCIDKGYMLDENQTLPDHAKPKWRKAKRKRNVKFE